MGCDIHFPFGWMLFRQFDLHVGKSFEEIKRSKDCLEKTRKYLEFSPHKWNRVAFTQIEGNSQNLKESRKTTSQNTQNSNNRNVYVKLTCIVKSVQTCHSIPYVILKQFFRKLLLSYKSFVIDCWKIWRKIKFKG
jgi:hypothetical protein